MLPNHRLRAVHIFPQVHCRKLSVAPRANTHAHTHKHAHTHTHKYTRTHKHAHTRIALGVSRGFFLFSFWNWFHVDLGIHLGAQNKMSWKWLTFSFGKSLEKMIISHQVLNNSCVVSEQKAAPRISALEDDNSRNNWRKRHNKMNKIQKHYKQLQTQKFIWCAFNLILAESFIGQTPGTVQYNSITVDIGVHFPIEVRRAWFIYQNLAPISTLWPLFFHFFHIFFFSSSSSSSSSFCFFSQKCSKEINTRGKVLLRVSARLIIHHKRKAKRTANVCWNTRNSQVGFTNTLNRNHRPVYSVRSGELGLSFCWTHSSHLTTWLYFFRFSSYLLFVCLCTFLFLIFVFGGQAFFVTRTMKEGNGQQWLLFFYIFLFFLLDGKGAKESIIGYSQVTVFVLSFTHTLSLSLSVFPCFALLCAKAWKEKIAPKNAEKYVFLARLILHHKSRGNV